MDTDGTDTHGSRASPPYRSRPAVLVIAGVDSSGGAGLARDLAVLEALQVDASCAVTAVTTQSHAQVFAVHHVPAPIIQSQITAALRTRTIAAIKIGMLGTRASVAAVVSSLPAERDIPLVLDPVLVSSSGGVLLDEPGRQALRSQLLPRVTLLTPNLAEAATLTDGAGGAGAYGCEATILQQGRELLRWGPQAVLIKGGHAAGEFAVDYLFTTDQSVRKISTRRLDVSARGTGCTLASAIAAGLAHGLALSAACAQGQNYVAAYLAARAT